MSITKLLIPFLVLGFINLNAQIKVESGSDSELIGNIGSNFSLKKNDNNYTFCYDDIKFTQVSSIKCFTFQNLNGDFENLFKVASGGFENIPKEDIKLDLPDDKVLLHYTKNFGIVSMQFISINKQTGIQGFSPYLTKKQLTKLFGKK